MKHTSTILKLAAFAALISLASCTKDKCETCTLYVFNAELYAYDVSVTGQKLFSLKPAETKKFEISSGQPYTVIGKPNTYYAHSDFVKSIKCDGECGDLLVTVQN